MTTELKAEFMKKLITLLAFFPALAMGQINLSAYCTDASGVPDSTACFNAAVSDVCSSPITRTLIVSVGKYRFASAPAAPTCAANFVGEGPAASFLIKDYSGGGFYFLKRVQNSVDTYGGGSIRDLAIWAGVNSHDGIAIWVLATPDVGGISFTTKNPHGLLIDNIQIGADVGGGTFGYGIYLDGSQNNGPGALGIRSVMIRGSRINLVTYADIYLYHAKGTQISNTECYGNASYRLVIDGASEGTIIVSRTCAPTIINGIETYKWP